VGKPAKRVSFESTGARVLAAPADTCAHVWNVWLVSAARPPRSVVAGMGDVGRGRGPGSMCASWGMHGMVV
jgi:hypothetical protein